MSGTKGFTFEEMQTFAREKFKASEDEPLYTTFYRVEGNDNFFFLNSDSFHYGDETKSLLVRMPRINRVVTFRRGAVFVDVTRQQMIDQLKDDIRALGGDVN